MKKTLVASITLVAIAILIAACNGGTPTTSKTSTSASQPTTPAGETAESSAPDPCDIIEKADAADIMGEAVTDHMHVEVQGGESCSYQTTAQPPRTLTLTIFKPCSMADYSNLAYGEPVDDLGMHAAWNKSLLTVHTEDGSSCIVTDGGGPARTDAPSDDATALMNAKLVATKLIDGMNAGASPQSDATHTSVNGM